MSFPYRCSRTACRQRTSLRRKLEHYARPRRCPSCRHDSLRLDRWKLRDHRRSACYCDGYDFIHRRGSLRCNHYRGTRDPDWERLALELGAMPMLQQPGERVPF